MKVLKFLAFALPFFSLILALCFSAYSHELTIILTGNTHASLYPCGKCPASVGQITAAGNR